MSQVNDSKDDDLSISSDFDEDEDLDEWFERQKEIINRMTLIRGVSVTQDENGHITIASVTVNRDK